MMYVTHVARIGTFLKIYGQRRKDEVVHMEATIQRVVGMLIKTPTQELLTSQEIMLGRYSAADFGRCKVTGFTHNGLVAVHFIDYGQDAQLSLSEIRLLNYDLPEIDMIKATNPLVFEYILSRITGEFTPEQVILICKELSSLPVKAVIEDQIGNYSFIGISLNSYDYSDSLIQRNIGVPINTEIQKQLIIQSLKPNYTLPRTITKTNHLNISESKQMIMSHLASNHPNIPSTQQPNIPPFKMNTGMMPAMPFTSQNQPQIMRLPSPMYAAPSGVANPNPYTAIGYDSTVNTVNNLNNPQLSRNPYSPQASATYNNQIPANILNQAGQTRQTISDASYVIPSFKSNELGTGMEYSVFCSYIENGPNKFSVQLKSSEEDLDQMMSDLSNIPLKNLTQKPQLGMACIARYSEDKLLYRAVIMNIMLTECQVVYVDYGNAEPVKYDDIYEIPQEFLHHSVFALRFALYGSKQLEPLTPEIKSYFRSLVMEHELKLTVVSVDGPMFLQYCNLFYNGHSVLELLLNKIRECPTFTPPMPLTENEFVVIRYVETPKKFFIQQTQNIMKYDNMMDKLMLYCLNAPSVKIPRKGMACAAKYNQDQDWYRVEILELLNDKAMVQFVDFGICNEVKIENLKTISLDFLTLPCQAIECCLNGFENIQSLSDIARDQLEYLAEDSHGNRRNFRAKIIDRLANSVLLVNLHDDSDSHMDLSIRMFQLSMPPKTFRYLEQHKFQKPVILDTFAQTENVANSSNKDMINSTMINETRPSPSQMNGDNPNTTSKSSNWDEKPDDNTDNLNTDTSQNWQQGNDRFASKSNRNNASNWDESSKNNQTSDWDKQNETKKFSSNNDRGNRWRDKDQSPKSDGWNDNKNDNDRDRGSSNRWNDNNRDRDRDRDRGSNRWNDNNRDRGSNKWQDRGRNDRENKYNRSNDDTKDQSASQENWDSQNNDASNKWRNDSQGYGSNSKQSTGEETSWDNNDQNPSKDSSDSGYRNSNRRDDYKKSFRDKHPPAYLYNKQIIPRFNKPNRLKGSDSAGSRGSFNQKSESNDNALDAEEFISYGGTLPEPEVSLNETVDVVLSWWISPIEFYVYQKSKESEYETLMGKIQKFYKSRDSVYDNPVPGTYVIVKNNQDQLFYRSLVLAYNENLDKFKVHLIDLGRKAIVSQSEMWLLEMRFTQLPKMAIKCTLNVTLNANRQLIQNRIDELIDSSKNIQCSFKNAIDYTYAVDLFIEDINLKNSLIEDGLVSAVIDDLEFSRLVDQIAWSTIVSADQLDNVRIKIYGCDVLLTCSCKHWDILPCPNLTEDFQTMFVGQQIPIEIHEIEEKNKLLVTPMVDIFGIVPTYSLCPCPVLKTNSDINVAYIESLNVCYVHLYNNSNDLKELLNDMYEFYDEKKDMPPCEDLSISKLCAAKSSDANWYRCEIKKIEENEVTVKYLDYGNCEKLSKDNVKDLDSVFRKLPALAIKIYLPVKAGDPDNSDDVVNEIETLTSGFLLTMTILEMYKNFWIADISSNNRSLILELKDRELGDYLDLGILKELMDKDVEPRSTAVPYPIDRRNRIRAFISHTDHPGRFFLQLESDQNDLDQLQENLQIVAPSLPSLEDFSEGKLCIVKYSMDDLWYRAVIIDSDSEITSIQFIDYGNTDTITDNNLIKLMNDAFVDVKRYSIPCSLPLTAYDKHEWSDAACQRLQAISNDVIEFEYICQNKTKNFVRLYANDHDIIEELLVGGWADEMNIVENGQDCFISHINSLSDFYIQMASASAGLETISSYLSDEEKFIELDDVVEGEICTAQYAEDGQWYRASILHRLPDKTEVLFVDYGNVSFTTNLRELPQDIANLPYQSTQCSLQLPDGIDEWTVEANERFHELAQMGATVFTVHLISLGERATVDLLIKGRSICDELIEFCQPKQTTKQNPHTDSTSLKNGYVSVISSMTDFYVQLENQQTDLDNITEMMSAAAEFEQVQNDNVNELCAALFDNDGLYYRGRIVEKLDNNQYKICFIDYGNISTSSDIRALPSHIIDILPLAYHCSVQQFHSEELANKMKKYVLSNADKTFQFEFIDSKQDPQTVAIFLDGINIAEVNYDDGDNVTDECIARDAEDKQIVKEICNGIINTAVENASDACDIVQKIVDSVCNEQNIDLEIGEEICNEVIDKAVERAKDNKLVNDICDEIVDLAIEKSIPNAEANTENVTTLRNATITWFNSLNSFYIQFADSNVSHIEATMENADNWTEIKNKDTGTLCAARYNSDQQYYRAKILEQFNDSEYKVHFIDYGNDSISNDLREIPEDFGNMDELAIHCALKETLNPKQIEQLKTFISANLSETYQVQIHDSVSEPQIVSLYFNETNVTDLPEMNSNSQINSTYDLQTYKSNEKITEEFARGIINDIIANVSIDDDEKDQNKTTTTTERQILNGKLWKDDTTSILKSNENINKEDFQ